MPVLCAGGYRGALAQSEDDGVVQDEDLEEMAVEDEEEEEETVTVPDQMGEDEVRKVILGRLFVITEMEWDKSCHC